MSIKWYESPALKGKVHLLSPECRDLLDKIFVLDPTKRITVPEIIKHPFFTEYLDLANQVRSSVCAKMAQSREPRTNQALAFESCALFR